MKPVKNIVYLYSEVMPYAIAVMRALVQEFGIQVDCIYWDGSNKKTPFHPKDEAGISFYKRSGYDKDALLKFVEDKQPSIIYISGRMDKLYLQAALHFKNRYPIITACDNQWNGSLKHYIASVFGGVLYRKYFDYVWICGRRQYEYAKRVGFTNNNIVNGMYTGDTALFNKAFLENKDIKAKKIPHNFVFVGRFAPEKGIDLLINAFVQAKEELQNDWQLVLVGAGALKPDTNAYPYIEVRDFMMPVDLGAASKNWGVFCLPSLKEPCGVVVHEFAAAGLPLICSDSVGAGDTFVINNYNGFVFKNGNVAALKAALKNMMQKPDAELIEMGERSNTLSKMHSPVLAAYNLISIINK